MKELSTEFLNVFTKNSQRNCQTNFKCMILEIQESMENFPNESLEKCLYIFLKEYMKGFLKEFTEKNLK